MAADFEDWFSATARCAKHASHAAASTCARCGAFCCDACLTQSWCEACALLVWREHLPTTARAVAWKLVLAPLFLLGSTVMWVLRGNTPSAVFFAWMVPVVCAAIVLRRFSPKAAWLGAVTSLLLLGWQALALFTDGAELRLIDVALLAIAPLLALDGAARLGRLFARVQVQESLERA